MKKFLRAVSLLAVVGSVGGCWGGYENPATEYVQRTDKITLGAGNATKVNAATNIIDPWPRRVGDRRIPGQSDHLVNVVEAYKGRSSGSGKQQSGQSSPPPTTDTPPATGAATPSSTLPF